VNAQVRAVPPAQDGGRDPVQAGVTAVTVPAGTTATPVIVAVLFAGTGHTVGDMTVPRHRGSYLPLSIAPDFWC
jgi:hypothetical protein